MALSDSQRELEGLRNLETQALGDIYDRYFPEVYRYVLYRVGDEAAAEDIASDVFMRLLEASQDNRRPRTNVKGWLFATANHAVSDHYRRNYRRPQEPLSDSLADHQPGPAFVVDQMDRKHAVLDAFAKLTSEQQHVLALRFGQGYSLEETAALMDRKVNAVKALQFRALASLQRGIGEVDDG